MMPNMQRRWRRSRAAPHSRRCEQNHAYDFLALLILQQASSLAALQFQFLFFLIIGWQFTVSPKIFLCGRIGYTLWHDVLDFP